MATRSPPDPVLVAKQAAAKQPPAAREAGVGRPFGQPCSTHLLIEPARISCRRCKAAAARDPAAREILLEHAPDCPVFGQAA